MNPGLILRGIAVMATLAGVLYFWEAADLGNVLSNDWIDSHIKDRGLTGEFLFLGLVALATGVGLPRQVVSGLAGYAFGLAMGTALALLGTVLGCIGAFYYARLLARAPLQKKFSGRVRRLDDFLHDHTFSMSLLIRMLPVGSNVATNLAAGVSSIRAVPFFTGSALGYLPQTVIFALLGSGVAVDPVLRITLSVVLFVASGLLGVYLYRRFRHGKSLDATIDEELGAQDQDAERPSQSNP
ncbi:TVP38/TMEM64 family protein [Magnetovibrio sp.]|uniref:TVP38/TMEM64 family protein n=1 Tax=Magnetovibrio sp. TaxID=2024836 RepID=UPI002F958617